MTDTPESIPECAPNAGIAGRRVAFFGKLGGVNRREAVALVREHGGVPVDSNSPKLISSLLARTNCRWLTTNR